MQPQSALAANLGEGGAQDCVPQDRVALEVGRQQAYKWDLRVSFPCTAHEAHLPCPLCPLGKQSICAGPLLPHLRKGATLLGISEDVTLASKRLSSEIKARAVKACHLYITMDQAVGSVGDSRGGLCGGDWHSSPSAQPCSPPPPRCTPLKPHPSILGVVALGSCFWATPEPGTALHRERA